MTAGTSDCHRVFVGLALALALATLRAPRVQAQPPSAEHEQGAVYAYTDDRGALVHVQRLQDVPLNLRHAVRRVDLDSPDAQPSAGPHSVMEWLTAAASGSPAQHPEPVMYKYRGARGQVVYTNLSSSVPPDQRERARIDLRAVPLNSELGASINRELEQRFDALRGSDACSQLRAAADESVWERAWRDQRVLVVCGGAMLLLLLASPWMHSRGWGAQWARVLFTAMPMLGLVAISGTLLMKANAMRSTLLPRADRCEPQAFQSAKGLPQRFGLVSALESEQQALAEIEREMPRP